MYLLKLIYNLNLTFLKYLNIEKYYRNDLKLFEFGQVLKY